MNPLGGSDPPFTYPLAPHLVTERMPDTSGWSGVVGGDVRYAQQTKTQGLIAPVAIRN
jgi:hypothetical protein